MKKYLSVLLALTLILSSCAFAESTSNVAYLFDEVSELLFDTRNVTVSIDADFTFDGLTFKKMDLDYKQDDVRSFLSYLLDTVAYEGAEPVKSGYTVWGTGATAYSVNVGKDYYNTHPTKVSDTLLLKNAKLTLAADLAKAVAVTTENALTVNEVSGNSYSFASGALPEFVNKTAYYLITDYIRNRYYVDIYHEAQNYNYESLGVSYEESWYACVAAQYQKLYGAALKDNYYDDPVEYNRYMVAENAVSQLENYVRTLYTNGYAVIRLDGSYEWYPTIEEVYRSLGQIDLTFENDRTAFCDFYQMKTGEELSEADYEILVNSPSEELWQAIGEMSTEMYDYYRALAYEKNPAAVSAIVKEDGTIAVLTNFVGSSNAKTLTETVIENIAMASLTGMELSAQLDENGKLAAGSGTVNFDVQYTDGSIHKLTIGFSATVTDRGSTKVSSEFKPEELGLETAEQYYNAQVIDEGYSDNWWLDLVRRAPDTITFNGKEYNTQYDMYR